MAERLGTLAGPLRISAPVTFGRMRLGPAIYRFLAQHPEIGLPGRPARRSRCGQLRRRLYASEPFQKLRADNGVTCSMSRSGNVWENAAMESFFSSLKTERIRGRVYRTRDDARADVFDYIERFHNVRRHSAIGYLSPVEFEKKVD